MAEQSNQLMGGKQRDDSCGTCRRKVKDDDQALCCNLCDMWHHIKCEKVRDDTYKFLTENDENCLHWYCGKCNAVAGKLLSTITSLARRQDDLEAKVVAIEQDSSEKFKEVKKVILAEVRKDLNNKPDIGDIDQVLHEIENVNRKVQGIQIETNDKISDIAKQFDTLKTMEQQGYINDSDKMNKLDEKVVHLEQLMQNSGTENAGAMGGSTNNVASMVRQEMDERKDIEWRKLNLIITGLKEEDRATVSEQDIVTKDAEKFKSMILKEFNIRISDIKVERVGMRSDTRPRMLKISFTNAKERKDILTKAKALRVSQDETARQIYIRPDLTIRQREEAKNMRAELKRRREEMPGKQFIIKWNQIKEI